MSEKAEQVKTVTPGPELIDTEELARRLNRTGRTVREWKAAGLLPFMKIGRKTVLFNWQAVLVHLEERHGVKPL
jgi:excisionase family DNA binding protein